MLVVDNCTLSALHRLDHLRLLSHLFSEVIIPLAVQLEFRDHWKNIPILDCFTVKLEEPPVQTTLENDPAYLRLGKGEREAIAWSLDIQALLATDDDKARKVAKNHGVKCIGTLGLLREGYRRGYFPDEADYLQAVDLLAKDLYLTSELLDWAKRT